MTKRVTALEVVKMDTGEVVKTIPIQPGNNPEKVLRGLLRNINTDAYLVREVTS